jgi:hypothetical protein
LEKADEWVSLLSRLNALVLSGDKLRANAPPEILSSGWCGLPPASQVVIQEAEERLGTRLPPSYRSFLSVANGWVVFSSSVEQLSPVGEVDWLRFADPQGLSEIQECYQEDDVSDENQRGCKKICVNVLCI